MNNMMNRSTAHASVWEPAADNTTDSIETSRASRELRMFAGRGFGRGPTRPSPTLLPEPARVAARAVREMPVTPVVPSKPTLVPVETQVTTAEPIATAPVFEAELLVILDASAEYGETIDATFRRKEAELRDVMARLSLVESVKLHDRLADTDPKATDLLASRFKVAAVGCSSRELAAVAIGDAP